MTLFGIQNPFRSVISFGMGSYFKVETRLEVAPSIWMDLIGGKSRFCDGTPFGDGTAFVGGCHFYVGSNIGVGP